MSLKCQGWNKKGGCKCENKAKTNSTFCGKHEPFVVDTCAICLEDMNTKGIYKELKCGHMFHLKCLTEWLNSGNENSHCCPTCRAPWRKPMGPIVYVVPEPPDFMWETILAGPRLSRDILNEIDPDNPPPLLFDNFLPGGASLSMTMTMERWIELIEV